MRYLTNIVSQLAFCWFLAAFAFLVRWRFAIEGWKAGVEDDASH